MTSLISLTDHRCSCGRLLFKAVIRTAWIEVKCRRCGDLVHFSPGYTRSIESSVVADRSSNALAFRDEAPGELLRSHALWVRVDQLWRVLTASEGFYKLAACAVEDVLGVKIFELFTPECAISIGNRLIEATGTHMPFVLECVILDARPSQVLRMHGVPQDNGEGYMLVFEGWQDVLG